MNTYIAKSTRMKRRGALALLISGFVGSFAFSRSKLDMRAFTIEFPNHVLDFAIPEQIASETSPNQIQNYFDPSSPGAFDDGSKILARKMYDFNGPIWVGALGSLTFRVVVHRQSAGIEGDISTSKGLKEYIPKWYPLAGNPVVCDLSEVVVNGTLAVSRRFGDWDETLSFPLDHNTFVDFGLRIERVAGKATGSWTKDAVFMRDAIRASIVFRQKSSASSSKDPHVAQFARQPA